MRPTPRKAPGCRENKRLCLRSVWVELWSGKLLTVKTGLGLTANKSKLDKLLPTIDTLSANECLKLARALKQRESQVEGSVVLQQRAENITACPHCHSHKFHKHGNYKGVQRFKCLDCAKTFSPTTGTPLARLRYQDKHIANAKCMVQGLTVRKTAKRLGVDTTTAFRWRHRFLKALRDMNPSELSGIVEADETFFLESFKGKRQAMPRPAHKRGEPAAQRGLSAEQIPVLVARDRSTGKTLTEVLPSRKAKDIGRVLVPVLAPDVVLCSDEASAYRSLARQHGIDLRTVPANPKRKRKGATYHIQNVNAYDSRLKEWMARFHGVATKNLPNYLGWHRFLDVPATKPSPRKFFTGALGELP